VADIADDRWDGPGAADLSFGLPEDVLADAAGLATRVSVVTGQGEAVLLALTGRAELPPSFSVV
jgi:hypothetical protein